VVFVETPIFTRRVYDYLDDDAYGQLQAFLSEQPGAGKIIRNSGGIRKLRWPDSRPIEAAKKSINIMRKELFEELLESVKQAKAIERGDAKPSREFVVNHRLEVARVRAQLGLSQSRFAALLGISANTLKNWEQGRRQPTGAARVLIKVAARHPKIVLEAAA